MTTMTTEHPTPSHPVPTPSRTGSIHPVVPVPPPTGDGVTGLTNGTTTEHPTRGRGQRPPTTVILTGALTALVAGTAFAISFASLMFVARMAGVANNLAPLYPVCVDALLAVGVLAAVVMRHAPLRSRLFVWVLIGAAGAVSVAGNVAHARHGGGTGWAVAAGAVPPLALMVCLELLVMLVRHSRQGGASPVEPPAAPGPVSAFPVWSAPAPRRAPAKRNGSAPLGAKSAAVRAYDLEHPAAGASVVAAAVGCSVKHVRDTRKALAASPHGSRP